MGFFYFQSCGRSGLASRQVCIRVCVFLAILALVGLAFQWKRPGCRILGDHIKKLAQKHDISTAEIRARAQTLDKNVKVVASTPATLYEAVAEILACIYKTRNKWRG
jgi:hypothetical protein